jgi:hypothetical protein
MNEKICGTYEANNGFFIITFGFFGILAIVFSILNFPHISIKGIIIGSILLGIMLWGILYYSQK